MVYPSGWVWFMHEAIHMVLYADDLSRLDDQ